MDLWCSTRKNTTALPSTADPSVGVKCCDSAQVYVDITMKAAKVREGETRAAGKRHAACAKWGLQQLICDSGKN